MKLWIVCLILIAQNNIYNVLGRICSSKLESALDLILKRSQLRSGSQKIMDFSGSVMGKSFNNDDNIQDFIKEFKNYRPTSQFFPKPPNMHVDIAQLRVRIPENTPWVKVDKCYYIQQNQTLDTRLQFPDLQISGRILMHGNSHCDMILRLRRAGIDFQTVPLIRNKGFGRQANVRTDSHFSEPGFVSVFAHACEGPTTLKYRMNSKRRHFMQNNNEPYESRAENPGDSYDDDGNVQGDILKFHDDNNFYLDGMADEDSDYDERENNSRTLFYKHVDDNSKMDPNFKGWHNIDTNVDDAYNNEIENLFSKGVKGLLTNYMQKALQPAIKETLMESMGYKLSYG